ncbi:MAG: DUF4139 domain-containing protein [Crocinitomicaceae bacterium]|nr:DUF4139 domain-containing protein [Crocinitomicaceae bacterium]
MKKFLFTLLLIPFFGTTQKTNTIRLDIPISKVKLFPSSGEMVHQKDIKLTSGRNLLIFSELSAQVDPQSIQFSADQEYRLISVTTELDFKSAEMRNERIVKLKDSLNKLNDDSQLNKDELAAYQTQMNLLSANQNIKGDNATLTVAQLREAMDFYRQKTLEISRNVSRLNKERTELNMRLTKVKTQLSELNFKENQRSNQIIILIDVESSAVAACKLSYLVSNCGWEAAYDLSAKDLNEKINLKYKARLYNNTGNDWNNVDLVLSTADPKMSATQPILAPWYVNVEPVYQAPISIRGARSDASLYIDGVKSESKKSMNTVSDEVYENRDQDNKQGVNFKQIEVNAFTTEFNIKDKFSCPSDAKPYSVDIKEVDLPSTFTHFTVPKMDNGAFIMANILNWQELELISGPSSIYLNGAFIGNSEIDTRSASDTLSLSFGRDNKVVVLRKLKKEMSSRKVMGSSKRETFLYETTLRNNHPYAIKINVFDQIPISKNDQIGVTQEVLSNGVVNSITGEVKWEITLQPGESKTFDFGYSVKYPKDMHVRMTQYRTVSAPSF